MDAHDNLDQLIDELNSSRTAEPPSRRGDTSRLERWLQALATLGGSDLLLVAGAPPAVRMDGRLQPLAEGPLDGVDIENAVLPALAPHARRLYQSVSVADASFRIAGAGRLQRAGATADAERL